MRLPCDNTDSPLEFEQVDLHFANGFYQNVFQTKNNKTLGETLNHRRYSKLAEETRKLYSDCLNMGLGNFLFQLKGEGDAFYKKYLNKYGDSTYSRFLISDVQYLDKKGIYIYLAGEDLKYIGRCKDSMKKRVNQGYGKIHPKNCYLDGQATNCHLNSQITACDQDVTLWLCPLDNNEEIERLEVQLIRQCAPPWNIQRG